MRVIAACVWKPSTSPTRPTSRNFHRPCSALVRPIARRRSFSLAFGRKGRIAMQTRSLLRPRIVLLLMPLLLTVCARTTKAPAVLQGDFRVHDPSIMKQDGAYYIFSTGDEQGLNQGTIQIRRSTDLTHWELAGT